METLLESIPELERNAMKENLAGYVCWDQARCADRDVQSPGTTGASVIPEGRARSLMCCTACVCFVLPGAEC